ncbi:MAG: multidrug effflux MFS transporter [Rhodobacteraceae bacterium]|nr:multidrug effflux MFS transporter [Paracoccaceae bacterium]
MSNHTTAPAPLMSERRVSILGAMLVAIGPVSMAIYTPAMAELVTAFDTTEAVVKMTLTLYFGGFAFAQLVAGPLSDALGRKPVTLGFLALYCVASVLALFAPSVEVLVAARFAQGLGASVGVAVARALVRDLFTDERSSRIMNLIGIILALGPALAPSLGGLMLGLFGWRSIFVLMLAIGLVMMVVVALAMRETVTRDLSRLNLPETARTYRMLLGNRYFMSVAIVLAGSMGAIYAQATFLPFILMGEVGLTPTQFGLGMILQSGSFFLGSLLARQVMGRIGADRMVPFGFVLLLLGAAGTASLLFGPVTFLHVMLPISVYVVGISFVMPGMSTAGLAPFGRNAGAAAALMGFFQMGSGLMVGTLGALMPDTVVAMALLIPAMGLVAMISYLVYRRHTRGGPPVVPGPRPERPAPVAVPARVLGGPTHLGRSAG